MIEMQNWATKAVAKLEEGRKAIPAFNADEVTKKLRDSKIPQKQKEQIIDQARVAMVANRTCEALCKLCHLDSRFAQTVFDGGSLKECLEKAMEGVDYEISDLELINKSAAFYFPTAKIEMEMRIVTVGEQQKEDCSSGEKIMRIDLMDFLR